MQHKIWNGLVLALGTTCVLSPNLTRLGPWLMSLGMGWSIHLIHVLGGLALLTAEWKTFKKHILASRAWNFVLLGAGIVGILSPDLSGLTGWLNNLHISWATHVAHGIGGLMLFAASLGRMAGRLVEPTELPCVLAIKPPSA